MAPHVMRSSIDGAYSLTIAQAASADATLLIMTIAAVVFVPGVLLYTAWGYKVFSGRISAEAYLFRPIRSRGEAPKRKHQTL